jgi:hypothetical protein
MRVLHPHILSVGRFFVLLFLLANSGFTVVLYHCTMEGMNCCATAEEQTSRSCSIMDPPEAAKGPALSSGDSCLTVSIAGGLTTDPTVVQKEPIARSPRMDFLAPFHLTFAFSSVSPQYHLLAQTASLSVSPPAVEQYVLNSSFLI